MEHNTALGFYANLFSLFRQDAFVMKDSMRQCIDYPRYGGS